MAGIRVIAKATDRIAKFRDAKKMVRASGDARRGSTSKPMEQALSGGCRVKNSVVDIREDTCHIGKTLLPAAPLVVDRRDRLCATLRTSVPKR